MLKLGSLFDGSGGFPLAGVICGVEPVWASQVEPYPISITKERFPNMKHLGDVSKVNGASIEPVDIITFGSPCQDLSVAGRQAGIHEGQRSNLFFQAIRIIKEMRQATNGKYPAWAVWQNVPGAFSSSNGSDFAAVLAAFASVCTGSIVDVPIPKDGWKPDGQLDVDGGSIAWRLYDGQHYVPQRRKRIYLVADFRGQQSNAGALLFEQKGLLGDLEPSIKAWEDFTYNANGGAYRGGR